jgi:hypothetical protein
VFFRDFCENEESTWKVSRFLQNASVKDLGEFRAALEFIQISIYFASRCRNDKDICSFYIRGGGGGSGWLYVLVEDFLQFYNALNTHTHTLLH